MSEQLHYIWRALFQNALSGIKKKRGSNTNAKFDYYVIEKIVSHMNKYVYMYIFMTISFPKYNLQTWDCTCNLDLWNGA